jgi:hypothetical protein
MMILWNIKIPNFIPMGTDYDFMISSKDEQISPSINKESWEKVVYILNEHLAPMIARKLTKRIFEEDETIEIGGIDFNKEGYFCERIFGSKKEVFWDKEVYMPRFESGEVILFWKKKDKVKWFKSVKMDKSNAVVIPYLVELCVSYFNFKKENEKKKSNKKLKK